SLHLDCYLTMYILDCTAICPTINSFCPSESCRSRAILCRSYMIASSAILWFATSSFTSSFSCLSLLYLLRGISMTPRTVMIKNGRWQIGRASCREKGYIMKHKDICREKKVELNTTTITIDVRQ